MRGVFSRYVPAMLVALLAVSFFGLELVSLPPAHALESYKKLYLDGMEYMERGAYDQALRSLAQAISLNGNEKKKIRYYGMRYGEYMPHRQKGICHYMLKQYPQAVRELEISIATHKTDAAVKYLQLANMEMAKQNAADSPVTEFVQTPEELKQLQKARQVNRHAVAVVIGNRDYQHHDIPSVDYAVRDAQLIKDLLITTCGYRDGNIIYHTNASKGVLENIFGSAQNHKGMLYDYISPGRSEVFVYYSGHGAPSLESKKGYLLPVDGNPSSVGISGYSLELLYGNLAKLRAASITVVTDACFSGAPLFKKASPVGIVVKNPLVTSKHAFILNSSAGTQLSSWYPEKGHGLFTYYFVLGMTGRADVDGDKQITFKELSAFVNDHVPYMARKLYSGRRQTPVIKAFNPQRVVASFQ